jgi:glycosyltransferase involved in cell wall biosynthesis
MSRRLKVLISAYACEPDKGSEPEVGWQWALQMARFHEVTVLTRSNNRLNIERRLEELQGVQPLPDFVYHDDTNFLLGLKQRLATHKLYYILWQRSAHELVAELHAERAFDLMHHVTFAGFRYPTAIWGHGVPSIWGPIGGIESVPWRLLPWTHLSSLFGEVKRNLHNLLQAAPLQVLPKRANASTLILASTPEMREAFQVHGFDALLMPTIGLKTQLLPPPKKRISAGPLRLLFVGNIITLKGVDLALHALKESGCSATFTLIGDGKYQARAKQLVKEWGLTSQVQFEGRLPRERVLQRYAEFDAFLFPSLHDTGGYAVIEAMCNELPVICLRCGGPAVAVQEGCGITVPLGTRRQVITDLVAAIRTYDQNRSLMREHGRTAREAILKQYDWDKKGEEMNEVYQKAASSATHRKTGGYTGITSTTHVVHRMVSLRGLAATLIMLLLIGMLGFVSLSRLKSVAKDISQDTLPALSLAGQANAYLADASRVVLYILEAEPARRAEIRKEIDTLSARTTSYLEDYRAAIHSPKKQSLYNALVSERQDYIQTRNRILELAATGQPTEALQQFQDILLPKHRRIKAAGDDLINFDIREGEARSKEIMHSCTLTQILVAAIGVLVFIFGFIIGLFR